MPREDPRWGVQAVSDVNNEVPAGPSLLDRLELDGRAEQASEHCTPHWAAGWRQLFVLCRTPPSWPSQANPKIPSGRFLPLNCSRSNGPTAGWNGEHWSHYVHVRTDGLSPSPPVSALEDICQFRPGQQETETVWLIRSLTSEDFDASRLLELVRGSGPVEKSRTLEWPSAAKRTVVPCAPPRSPRSWVF